MSNIPVIQYQKFNDIDNLQKYVNEILNSFKGKIEYSINIQIDTGNLDTLTKIVENDKNICVMLTSLN